MTEQKNLSPTSTNYQTVLSYYKDKVDSLEKQREAWLAKLDECGSRMAQKQQKHHRLRQLRNQNGTVDTGIVHHAVARFDQQLNALNLDRQNQNLEFQEAQQLIKMQQLAEEFPIIAQKCIPCIGLLSGDLIDNDLNLHNQGNGGKYINWDNRDGEDDQYCQQIRNQGGKTSSGINRMTNTKFVKSNLSSNINTKGSKISQKLTGNSQMVKSQSQKQYVKGTNYGKGSKTGNNMYDQRKAGNTKKTLEQVMKMQIIQTQKTNDKQIALMEQQQKTLQQSIIKLKQKRKLKTNNQRNFVKQIQKKYSELEKKHKQLAQNYFNLRRQHKQKNNGVSEQNQKLKKTYSVLDDKIADAMRIYQKQNKAKQALILRKSQDFQQDYKAKMRAKQRNLQALKQNYEKMQQLCIQKVRKLEATVQKAKYQLQDAEQRRRFLVQQLRQQLRELQKRVNEQRIQKARIDLKLKQKMLEDKQREQEERQRQQKQRKIVQREEMIKSAYKKTALPQRFSRNNQKQKHYSNSKSKSKQKQLPGQKGKRVEKYNVKQNKKKTINNAQSSEEDEEYSLDIADLDKLRNDIKYLQKKIAKQELLQ